MYQILHHHPRNLLNSPSLIPKLETYAIPFLCVVSTFPIGYCRGPVEKFGRPPSHPSFQMNIKHLQDTADIHLAVKLCRTIMQLFSSRFCFMRRLSVRRAGWCLELNAIMHYHALLYYGTYCNTPKDSVHCKMVVGACDCIVWHLSRRLLAFPRHELPKESVVSCQTEDLHLVQQAFRLQESPDNSNNTP